MADKHYPCEICKKVLFTSNSKRQHKLRVHSKEEKAANDERKRNEKKFPCKVEGCDFRSSSQEGLRTHAYRHKTAN